MKNNIVQFTRPITYIFCHEKLKCWVRSLGIDYSMVSLSWDDMKLVCCKVNNLYAQKYAQRLISNVLRRIPLDLPDEFLDIEDTSDPIPGKFVNKKAETTQTVLGNKEYLLEYYRKRIITESEATTNEVPSSESLRFILNTLSRIYQEREEHNSINQIEKDAERLAREYPSMTKEQWKVLLLKNLSEQ